MTIKRLTIFTLVFAMMALFAGAVVSAQNDDAPNGRRGGQRGFGGESTVILEATGLTSEEFRAAIQDGATIADLITANGGNVNAAIGEHVVEAMAHINEGVAEGRLTQEQADEIIAGLGERITERFNGTFERPERFENSEGSQGRRGGQRGQGKPNGQGFGFNSNTDDA